MTSQQSAANPSLAAGSAVAHASQGGAAAQATVVQRKTLHDTIKEIEAQITLLENTPNATTRQQADLAKLKELHARALSEQEKLKTSKQLQQQLQQQQATPTTTPARTATPPSSTNAPSLASTSSTAAALSNVVPTASSKPTATGKMMSGGLDINQILDKKRIQDLVKEVDPNTQLDEDVEEMLLQVADDFIENIVTTGCQLAKHRKSNILEATDILLHLERNWNIVVPGYSSDEHKQYKRPSSTEAHKQRMALIRKTLKK